MRGLLMTAEKKGWKPWANTICYLPIDDNDTTSTVYDHSWNGNNFSCTNCSFQTSSGGKRVLHLFNWRLSKSGVMLPSPFFTINIWSSCAKLFSHIDKSGFTKNYWITISDNNVSFLTWSSVTSISWTPIRNSRYNICVTINTNNNQKVYINWVQVGSSSANPDWTRMSTVTTYLWYDDWQSQSSTWYIWATILESGNRTEQQVLDYFNLTKRDYWIS